MRIKNCLIIFMIIIFLGGLFYSGYNIIVWMIDNNNTNNKVNEIKKISNIKVNEDDTISVDFDKLLKNNKDVVGWIKVNNTKINYPVVKHSDNDYYLNHSFDNSYNGAGWVFMDYRNKIDDLDNNTIIYGHGRKDGSMFGSLTKTLDKEWYMDENNLIVQFSTLNSNYLFQVFSIYVIDTTDDYININYDDSLLNNIINRSVYKFDTSVKATDKILTLSTCYNNDKKTVMHAKMISNG